MKFLVLFALVALAMGQDCSEERVEGCLESLLSSIIGDTTEEDVCRELGTTVRCLRNVADECVEGEDEELEESLQELEKVVKENCGEADDDDSDMQKCFEENEDYIFECIFEGATKALELFMGKDVDENTVQCLTYGLMAECFIDRVGEKCGQEAADAARTELHDLPSEIEAACKESEHVIMSDIELLDDDKKKK